MTGSDFHLGDSDAQLLRSMIKRIEQLEFQTSERISPGVLVPCLTPVRSSKWSDTHMDAIGENWNHHYQLNEINSDGVVKDRTVEEEFDGFLAADSESSFPQQGQIGGLISDGSYSIYFPGKDKSRIDLPLLSKLTTDFSFEVMFKPETIPQLSVIFYNGDFGSNGWGIGIGSVFGTSGNRLLIRRGSSFTDSGILLVAGQWYDVNVVESGGQTSVTVATLNPVTKVMTVSQISVPVSYSEPTVRSCIGGPDQVTNMNFKGWVDEVNLYDGVIPLTEAVNSNFDRYLTALEAPPPPGFVKPDGVAVSRARFDRLYKAIGTIYGAGDGSTTFNLPNLSGRMPVGISTSSLGVVTEWKYTAGASAFPSTVSTNWLVKT